MKIYFLFIFQGIFVNNFKKAGPEIVMHVHANPNDFIAFFSMDQVYHSVLTFCQ